LADLYRDTLRSIFIKALRALPYLRLQFVLNKTEHHVTMYVIPDGYDSIEENVLYNNVYFSSSELVKYKTIIDLGAHHGSFTIYALYSASPYTRIIVVEPNPLSYTILLNNLYLHKDIINSKKLSIIPIRAAIWHEKTKLLLNTTNWSETAHVMEYNKVGKSNTISKKNVYVETITMDEILKVSKPPIAIKMDIEGAEYVIFKEKAEWLDHINAISLEVHGDHKEIIRILLRKRFNVRIIYYCTHYTLSKEWLKVRPLWYSTGLSFYRFIASTISKPTIRIIKALKEEEER